MKEFFWNLFFSSFICSIFGLMLLSLISNLKGALYTTPPGSGKTVLAISLLIALIYTIIQQIKKKEQNKREKGKKKVRNGILNPFRKSRKGFFYFLFFVFSKTSVFYVLAIISSAISLPTPIVDLPRKWRNMFRRTFRMQA